MIGLGYILAVALLLTALPAGLRGSVPRSSVDSQAIRPRFNVDPGRIINGTEATLGATRHQVGIRKALNDGYFFGTGHLCGGALIRPGWVLTAAHCFVDQVIYDGTFVPKEEFIVVMGNLDRFNKTNTLTFTIEERIMQLDKFVLSTYDKDIALLKLNGTVPANHPTIRPIALNRFTVAEGVVCQVTGWGTREDGYISDILMTVDVPMISEEHCVEDTDLGHLIKPGMICAGYVEVGEKDACSGDSGGPLVCQSLLAGIVSWGIDCALPRFPGVYTEVSYYYDWVLENMGEDSNADGSGDGSGNGSGDSSGDGSGDGSGNGDDDDNGSGDGGGDGDGSGDGGGGAMGVMAGTLTLLLPGFLALRLITSHF
ncbi:trypsin-1 [Drosophila eugracilis]|uniref:trypsin-1 n=1 Tax=Drosophila eugracilis TaxID=29029 RepID=UPI001BDA4B10|nr:trypsin-1 [Drosophila eugracilis]